MNSALQLANNPRESNGSTRGEIGERFLEFSFPKDVHALLPLGNLQGAVEVQFADILPVPQMPAALLGIFNWRGKSTWIADLSYLAGGSYYSYCYPQATKAMVLMVQKEETTIGLVIDRTISVVAYQSAAVLAIEQNLCVPALRSLVSGYFLDGQHQPWLMLNVSQVFQAIGL